MPDKTEIRIPIKKRGYPLVMLLLGILLAAGIFASFAIGRYPVTPGQLLAALFPRWIKAASVTDQMRAILFGVRMPRILLACMIGCCLSAAGTAYQGVFQNPLASPDVLGASSGAATGAALAILFQQPRIYVMAFAFAGSLITIAVVMLITRGHRGGRLLRIILTGMMISSLAKAATSFIKLVADPNNTLPEITYWLMGSLAKTKPQYILYAAVPMVLGLIPLLFLRWRINLLTLPDEESKTMGVNVAALRTGVLICATLITAACVSVSGLIEWVGLIVPNLVRRVVGDDCRRLMPASMLSGAIFLLIIDNISRNLLLTEIPIGILTAAVGAPFFVWLILRRTNTQ